MREYEVEEILSWVVCDPLGLRGIENEEIFMKSVKKFEKRIKNMLMEYSLGFKPYRFKNKISMIQAKMSPPQIEQSGYVDLIGG